MGKSSILQRFVDDNFSASFISTIGVDFKIKTINIQNKLVKLQIWDTAGQERFQTITANYYRGASGIFLVYDITSRESFERINYWLNQVNQFNNKNCQKVIIGNKADLEVSRQVKQEELGNIGEKYDISVMETSAKENINILQCFEVMATEMMANDLSGNKKEPLAGGIELDLSGKVEETGNCSC